MPDAKPAENKLRRTMVRRAALWIGLTLAATIGGEVVDALAPWSWETDLLQGYIGGLVAARLIFWPAEA